MHGQRDGLMACDLMNGNLEIWWEVENNQT
jgi:hypothetical protein